MSPINEHIDEIIAKVICNEASLEEKQLLGQWRKESVSNEKYINQMEMLMNPKDSSVMPHTFDADAAWRNVQKRIEKKPKVIGMTPHSRSVLSWRIAAVAIVLFGLGALIHLMLKESSTSLAFASQDEIRKDSLPDGSYSTLNRMSVLTYELKDKQRRATLKGEAFFDVKHDDQLEFIVETQDVFIRDIGTAFNVKSNEREDSIIVYVKEGEVSFYSETDQGLLLRAGEKGIYVKSQKKFLRSALVDENESSYADRNFKFRNTPMRRVIKRLKEVYGDHLELGDSALEDCRITVNFENDEIETIAGIIAETMGWRVQESSGVYRLIGEGCSE